MSASPHEERRGVDYQRYANFWTLLIGQLSSGLLLFTLPSRRLPFGQAMEHASEGGLTQWSHNRYMSTWAELYRMAKKAI